MVTSYEMALSDVKHVGNLPAHVAIIMDGNGRWAEKRKFVRVAGHKKGVERVQDAVETCVDLGCNVLTLFVFSEENWGRPRYEVNAIMSLIDTFVVKKRQQLHDNNIRLKVIGDLTRIPEKTRNLLDAAVDSLKDNTGFTLNIALSYGSQSELTHAMKSLAQKVADGELKPEDITSNHIEGELYTVGLPNPDLVIRTSGEQRISNFLLWQIAYAELYFSPIFWPDFGKLELLEAISAYQGRKRRFGLLDEGSSSHAPKTLRFSDSIKEVPLC